jgi:EAL domain-containing protein (putative c-di-GMP-specific phosphodiesterase class I)
MFDLRDDGFPDLVAERLAVHAATPDLLGIEVTESAAMADPNRTRTTLERLRALGVRVAVDDFGTGYSSLAHLVGLPLDELKIDRSFVVGMAFSTQHAATVRSTISLGHDLNLTVVAEGVEDDNVWERLRAFGCDLIQGYVVSRPLSAPQLVAWLDRERASTESAHAA